MKYFTRIGLQEAWNHIYKSKPAKKRKHSKGVDDISIEDFKRNEQRYLEELYRQLEGDLFVFSSFREFRIEVKRSQIGLFKLLP